jgi:hypothetical protein
MKRSVQRIRSEHSGVRTEEGQNYHSHGIGRMNIDDLSKPERFCFCLMV